MLTKDLLKETNNFSDIIFDLDNTIYQHCFFDRGAYNDIEEYFCRFNKKYIGFSKYLCNRRLIDGVEYGKLFDDAVLKFGLKFENVKKMIDIYSNHDARCLSAESSLVPILKVIVKSEQKRLFIVTNGKWKIQQTKIKKLGIDSHSFSRKTVQELLYQNRDRFDELLEKFESAFFYKKAGITFHSADKEIYLPDATGYKLISRSGSTFHSLVSSAYYELVNKKRKKQIKKTKSHNFF